DVFIVDDTLQAGGRVYPIVQDVIVLSDAAPRDPKTFAEDIQFTFGEEWKTYGAMLPEHRKEFDQYFDLIDLASLKQARVCDLGCGMGRWSFFAKDHCKEVILVDFSDAI